MTTASDSPEGDSNSIQSRGGKARAKSLTPEQRSESARHAAIVKWEKSPAAKMIPKATHSGELNIGGLIIPCANLDNGERVISDRSLAETLGIRGGGAYWKRKKKRESGAMLPEYVSAKYLQPFITDQIKVKVLDSITYKALNGVNANAIRATVLADICDIWIKAKQNGALEKDQISIADNAYTLLMGFASVGINALVDEATGYQYDRPRRDLEEQLKKFLSEHLRKWVRTFPADYFKHLCRLRGVELRPDMKLPPYFGTLTNNLIYRRLAPGLLKKLKERREERGHPGDKLHSWLSEDVGFRGVLVHLGIVVGLMKIHKDYEAFEKQLDTIAPIYPESPGLFDDPKDWEAPS
jgi:hypothetical protein